TTAPGLGVGGISASDLGNRPYAIRPSIGVGVLATDNLFQSNYDRRSDIVTTVAPSIEAAVSTVRLFGSLRYTPAVRLYASNSSQNGVDQVGDGQLLAALIPGTFYLDMRGAASVLPATAGLIPGSGQVVAGSNTLQTYTTQVTPFLVHNFGSAASSQLGYSFQYSGQSGAVFNNSDLASSSATANFTAHRGFAVLRSGEDLGRLALQARVDGIWYVGDGIYDDAHNFVAGLGARYAILRSVAVLGDIGYENQQYAGTNPVSIEDAIWSVGLRLTPSPDSIVIVRYGHRNGFNSFSLNAGVAVGVRTNLFAVYSDTLGTSLTQGQNLLATTTTDALGNTVDSQSGAPVVLINSFLGLSNTLYRMRIGTVSLNHRWSRDVFTLSGSWQAQDPVTSANNTPPVSSTSGLYATFNWAHDFSPNTTGAATVQYGHASLGQNGSGNANFGQTGSGDTDIYALAATLSHQLNEKLAATIQVAWTSNTSPVAGQGYTQGVIRAGLRRTF
ncbi:MAG TPA: TIGR03016 family PEP-CTERM system-associated outer membrane protein, partial [Reyranella sp.]|nr:TIGR03016 family PEP-CTERM system-associated outer membrane protein [Reyranella sp.]